MHIYIHFIHTYTVVTCPYYFHFYYYFLQFDVYFYFRSPLHFDFTTLRLLFCHRQGFALQQNIILAPKFFGSALSVYLRVYIYYMFYFWSLVHWSVLDCAPTSREIWNVRRLYKGNL